MHHTPLPYSLNKSIHLRFMLAVMLNMVLALTQVFYAHEAHSVSLLSDALHNLGDVLGLFIAWGAQTLASYPPKGRYTYGYKRLTILATFSNALLLMLSVGIISYEAISKLINPHAMDEISVLFIALLGVLINSGTALLFMKEKESDINIRAAFLHLILDALTSLGVVISALLVYYTAYQWIDVVIAFMIASVILVGSWQLLSRSMQLILAAVPLPIDLNAVHQYLMQIPSVENVSDLHIWAISTKENALTAHLSVKDHVFTQNDYDAIQKVLNNQFNIHTMTLQVDHQVSEIH